jgi:hypothetical protein
VTPLAVINKLIYDQFTVMVKCRRKFGDFL